MQEATQCKCLAAAQSIGFSQPRHLNFGQLEAELTSQLFNICVKQAWDSAEVALEPYLLSLISHNLEPNPFPFYPSLGKPTLDSSSLYRELFPFPCGVLSWACPRHKTAVESTLKQGLNSNHASKDSRVSLSTKNILPETELSGH